MIVRLILYGVLVWALVKLVKGLKPGPRPKPRPRAPEGLIQGGELVQDPQCGVYVPKETAVRGADGRFFCSPACRDAFEKRGG